MKRAGYVRMIFLLATLAGFSVETPCALSGLQGSKEKEIPVVRNSRKPIRVPGGPTRLLLVEELVIGRGAAENDRFSELRTVQADSEGRIYALDGKECLIKVFDAEGRFVAQFSLDEEEFVMMARDGKLYTLVREDAEGIPLVKRYGIVWK